MNQMPYPYMPNMPVPLPSYPSVNPNDKIRELEQRLNRLERQVKRLENKVFRNEFIKEESYEAYPPKDSGMYMM